MHVITSTAPCGGCGHRRPTGNEGFGLPVVCPECDRPDQASQSAPVNAATSRDVWAMLNSDSEVELDSSQSIYRQPRQSSRRTQALLFARTIRFYRPGSINHSGFSRMEHKNFTYSLKSRYNGTVYYICSHFRSASCPARLIVKPSGAIEEVNQHSCTRPTENVVEATEQMKEVLDQWWPLTLRWLGLAYGGRQWTIYIESTGKAQASATCLGTLLCLSNEFF
ncbi:Zinc finger, FLYWCH-type [Phytophthora cactorum]|nr:Zinc finger, FLYWCH-type [Phytophthora cactorum]